MKFKPLTEQYSSSSGYIFAIISSALYGSISTIAKPTVNDTDPILLAMLVSAITAIILFPNYIKSKSRVNRKNRWLILAIAGLGAVLAPTLYFSGLELTNASDATVLSNSEIIFTILLAIFFFKERLGRKGFLSMILVFAGLFFISTNLNLTDLSINLLNVGNLAIITAMFFWSIDNNLSKIVTKNIDVSKLIFLKSMIGAGILFFVSLFFGIELFTRLDWQNIVLLSLVSFALPMFFFYQAIKRIGAIKTILIFSTSSIFGLFYANLILGEQIQWYHFIGTGSILLGMLLLYKSK